MMKSVVYIFNSDDDEPDANDFCELTDFYEKHEDIMQEPLETTNSNCFCLKLDGEEEPDADKAEEFFEMLTRMMTDYEAPIPFLQSGNDEDEYEDEE